MLKVINLYGGPGTGKSTTAAELFSVMKKKGYRCELITEVAKDMVYSEEFFAIKDQLMVFARQHHKLWKLKDKVDWAIVDSPLPLSAIYAPSNMIYHRGKLIEFIMSTFNHYHNYNFYITRDNDVHGYQEYGRHQSLEEASELDVAIKTLLEDYSILHATIGIESATTEIVSRLSL